MRQLLYISTARGVVADAALADILAQSRRNNTRACVTGLLVVGGRRFLQVLEGDEAQVEATFARIQKDPRRFATVVLADRTVDDRMFGSWAMGCDRLPEATGGSGLSDYVEALISEVSDRTLHGYFQGFVQQHAA